MKVTNVFLAALVAACVSLPAGAIGVLDGNLSAFDNGGPNTTPDTGRWSGSAPFMDPQGNLVGVVDWAVFDPAIFPFAGYVPTPGELIYAYQIFVTGTDDVISLAVGLLNGPVNNIGAISDIPGVSFSGTQLNGPPGSTTWEFFFPGIATGQNSTGLAFSSNKLPTLTNGAAFGALMGGGNFATASPIATTGAVVFVPVPEPATAALLLSGGLLMLRRRQASA